MATYLQYPVKFYHIFQYNSKTIQSIFMKFSGIIDIVLSCTEKYIVTMEIIFCQIFSHITIDKINSTYLLCLLL